MKPRLYDRFLVEGLSNHPNAALNPPLSGAPTPAEVVGLPVFLIRDAVICHDETVSASGGSINFMDFPPITVPFPKFWMEWTTWVDEAGKDYGIAVICEWFDDLMTGSGLWMRAMVADDECIVYAQRAFAVIPNGTQIRGIKLPQVGDGAEIDMGAFSGPLFALSLMNCKNVVVKEDRMPRAFRRHPGKHAKTADVVHRIVVVPGSESYVRAMGGKSKGERSEIKKRLHIVRGHFATYSEDAPLFGKHVGRFYHPPHVRGDLSVGRVEKTYKVKP